MQLVPMTDAEFAAYRAVLIPEYAAEHVRAGNWPAEEAETLAEGQIQEVLPQGVATPDHFLNVMHVDTESEPVGVIWFCLMRRGPRTIAFVYDVIVYESYRRRGYARAALRLVEEQARALGAERIALHVFGYNDGARALYEGLGYTVTDISMAKPL